MIIELISVMWDLVHLRVFYITGLVYPSIPVNFKVFNVSENKYIDFAFLEFDNSGPYPNGWFSSNGGSKADRIVFLETKETDTTLSPTWWFYLAKSRY